MVPLSEDARSETRSFKCHVAGPRLSFAARGKRISEVSFVCELVDAGGPTDSALPRSLSDERSAVLS